MRAVHPFPVRLYCVPHAGATSSVFRGWQAAAPSGLQIVGVDRPGRGTRSREDRAADLAGLLDSTARFVIADLERARSADAGVRYATLGHSFGALPSLELAAAVERATGRPPACAILSAALPPRVQPAEDATTAFTDAEILERIERDGGTPPELLAVPAMAAHLVEVMRADLALRREFPSRAGLRVDFPLTLVAARDDPHVTPEQMWRWAEHSTAACCRVDLAGDHFAALRDPAGLTALVPLAGADDLSGTER